jgi:sarcosine oxidase subunit alpha
MTVNGQKVTAYQGETVLAALIAAGIKILKHNPIGAEPRGALCGMGVCFECTVTINGVPNIRSCMTEAQDGMEIKIDDQA